MTEDTLQHAGVKGMKWGIRKKPKSSGSSHKDAKKAVKAKELAREKKFLSEYQNRDKMSTRQLKSRVERLRTEQEFKRLAEQPFADRAKRRSERNRKIAGMALTAVGSIPVEAFTKDKKKQAAYKKGQAVLSGLGGAVAGKKKK